MANRAIMSMERERRSDNSMQQTSSSAQPPRKTIRMAPDEEDDARIFEEVKQSFSDEEISSEISDSFTRVHTDEIKDEPDNNEQNSDNEMEDDSNQLVSGSIPTPATQTFQEQVQEPDISRGEEELDLSTSNNIRGISKSGRNVKQTQFHGFRVASDIPRLFVSEHDMTDLDHQGISNEDGAMNPELIYRSRSEEIHGWMENNVFEEVRREDLPPETNVLTIRWVDSWKPGPMGTKQLKSRCVVRGCQESTEKLNTYAPTVSKEMMMLVTSLASSYQWQIEAIDVQKAFLQSRELQREVYVVPPREAVGTDKSEVWKLKNAVYGLGDAAREWYMTIRATLTEIGFKESKLEPSMFYLQNKGGKLDGIICVHVDDILLAGNRRFRALVEMLKEKIKVGKHQKLEFLFCGMKFCQNAVSKMITISVDPSKLNQMTSIGSSR